MLDLLLGVIDGSHLGHGDRVAYAKAWTAWNPKPDISGRKPSSPDFEWIDPRTIFFEGYLAAVASRYSAIELDHTLGTFNTSITNLVHQVSSYH